MDVTLGLLDHIPTGEDGGGGGVPSGVSTTASEVTSSYPIVDGSLDDLELGLGLSIGGGCSGCGGLKSTAVVTGGWSQHARILTAKDFPTCLVSKHNSCSSSSSVNIPNSLISGTKRTATDSVSPPNGTSVVGWPPVRKAHRIPSLANQIKPSTENFILKPEQNKSNNRTVGIKDYPDERNGIINTKYRSVKVNMDGTLIGRKVDLNAHTSYEMLAQTLQQMFFSRWPSSEAVKPLRLLDGTSEFVLTYEDKDGDCMLVGDVPWQMFLSSVKRLRIMKTSDSNELAPRFQENNERQK